ncbi:hypothetical protein ZWY2020_026928 [Hordeum vulgare]|nr:hypothetical protein ZWY2020_026928 [Hordeum vulgare]
MLLTIQMLLTIAIASVVIFVRSVALFFVPSPAGFGLYIFLIILPFIGTSPSLRLYDARAISNQSFVAMHTLIPSMCVTEAHRARPCVWNRSVVSSVLLLTAAPGEPAAAGALHGGHQLRGGAHLRLHQGGGDPGVGHPDGGGGGEPDGVHLLGGEPRHDFNFLGPFLFAAVMIFMVFALIQAFFPLGRISLMVYGGLATLVFCGYIIYDTDNLIKRYSYDEYVWPAVALYLDVINLFLSLLTLFRASDL